MNADSKRVEEKLSVLAFLVLHLRTEHFLVNGEAATSDKVDVSVATAFPIHTHAFAEVERHKRLGQQLHLLDSQEQFAQSWNAKHKLPSIFSEPLDLKLLNLQKLLLGDLSHEAVGQSHHVVTDRLVSEVSVLIKNGVSKSVSRLENLPKCL